jgi:hypothetical protein
LSEVFEQKIEGADIIVFPNIVVNESNHSSSTLVTDAYREYIRLLSKLYPGRLVGLLDYRNYNIIKSMLFSNNTCFNEEWLQPNMTIIAIGFGAVAVRSLQNRNKVSRVVYIEPLYPFVQQAQLDELEHTYAFEQVRYETYSSDIYVFVHGKLKSVNREMLKRRQSRHAMDKNFDQDLKHNTDGKLFKMLGIIL